MENIKEMLKNIQNNMTPRKLLIGSLVFCLFISVVGVSWAWFSPIETGDNEVVDVTVETGTLSITYNGGNEFSVENILPGWTGTKTFTVTNTGDVPSNYVINWANITNTFSAKGDFVMSVTSTNGGGTLEETQVSSTGTHMNIMNGLVIGAGLTQTYTITFKYINRESTQNDQGKSIKGKIEVLNDKEAETVGITSTNPTLASAIIANNPPTTAATTPGSVISETDEGLISGEEDDDGETLYFRGNVQDNYVSFAGKTWRVMRINGDGTVRMILDGTTGTDAVWNSQTDSTYNNTYQTDSHDTMVSWLTYSNSPLKTNIETWYSNNIGNNSNYSDKVATTKYCSDLTHTGTTHSSTVYIGTYNRIIAPTFRCPNAYTYSLNVATLNADEVLFAGSKWLTSNNSYYLYTGSWYWTMSPFYWHGLALVNAFRVHSDGNLCSGYVCNSDGVRPVISLKSGTLINNASNENIGTSTNPYVVS